MPTAGPPRAVSRTCVVIMWRLSPRAPRSRPRDLPLLVGAIRNSSCGCSSAAPRASPASARPTSRRAMNIANRASHDRSSASRGASASVSRPAPRPPSSTTGHLAHSPVRSRRRPRASALRQLRASGHRRGTADKRPNARMAANAEPVGGIERRRRRRQGPSSPPRTETAAHAPSPHRRPATSLQRAGGGFLVGALLLEAHVTRT